MWQIHIGGCGSLFHTCHCPLPSAVCSTKVKGGAQWMTELLLGTVGGPVPTCKLPATSVWQEKSDTENTCLEPFIGTGHRHGIQTYAFVCSKNLSYQLIESLKKWKTVTITKTETKNSSGPLSYWSTEHQFCGIWIGYSVKGHTILWEVWEGLIK